MKISSIGLVNLISITVAAICVGLYYHSWLLGVATHCIVRQLTPYAYER